MAPFRDIAAHYREASKSINEAAQDQWGCDIYAFDWLSMFSFIENKAWQEIRSLGIVMYPQYPIGKFFVDFASPQKKIVIECDGVAYHDKQKDDVRDQELIANGWTVYRIPGSKFMRQHFDIDDFWSEFNEERSFVSTEDDLYLPGKLIERSIDAISRSYSGVFIAIANAYFGKANIHEAMKPALSRVLESHISRPGVQ